MKLCRLVFLEIPKIICSVFRTHYLKMRLEKKYETIRFWKPKNPRHSQVIFAENFQHGDILKKLHLSDSEETETETETEGSQAESPLIPAHFQSSWQPPELSLQSLYNVAMMLREKVRKLPKLKVDFPPVAQDFDLEYAENSVPVELYNFLAWVTGICEEVEDGRFVEVDREHHLKILSILQDIMALPKTQSKPFLPKQLSLAVKIKHVTGSTKIVSL